MTQTKDEAVPARGAASSMEAAGASAPSSPKDATGSVRRTALRGDTPVRNHTLGLTVSYNGAPFSGFARQPGQLTVQGEIEQALALLFKRDVETTCAGRTDAGVHALGQCAHFDYPGSVPPEKLPFVFNSMLPRDIRVIHAEQAEDAFHARYDAKGKRYIYTIYNSPHSSALLYNRTMHVPQPLDIESMRAAAQHIIGTHDFKAFCASGSYVKSTVRTVNRLDIVPEGPLIRIIIEGNGFLYNMVRIIAGTLIRTGLSKLKPEEVEQIILSRSRAAAGFTAQPQGLMLDEVFY